MTKREMAAKLRQSLVAYESGVVNLWPLADQLHDYGLTLSEQNDPLAKQIEMLAIDLGMYATQVDQGIAPDHLGEVLQAVSGLTNSLEAT